MGESIRHSFKHRVHWYFLHATLVASLLAAGTAQATDWVVGNPGGFYDVGGEWVGGSAPGAGDPANFLSIGVDVIVRWDGITGNTTTSSVLIDDSNVTFRSSGFQSHTTTGNTTVQNGSTFTLADSATAGMILNVGSTLSLEANSTLNVRFDSDVTTNILWVGAVAGPAIANIDGVGSTISVTSDVYLGQNGNTGTLNFLNGSTGSSLGFLRLASSGVIGSTGIVNVSGGSQIATGNIIAGTSGLVGQSGSILIDGASSRLTQTGASTFTLGAASNSTGQLTICAV